MGIVYSIEKIVTKCDELSLQNQEILQFSSSSAQKYVDTYRKFKYPPILDNINLHSYFMNVERSGKIEGSTSDLVLLLWNIYEVKSICYIQEILVCIILLSDESWHQRLSLLFDVFKNTGSEEEIGYDDIILATQVVGVSLHRLWLSKEWNQGNWGHLTEALVDSAYAKLEKDIDTNLNREEFVQWAADRFKESRSISSPEALHRLYSSAFG